MVRICSTDVVRWEGATWQCLADGQLEPPNQRSMLGYRNFTSLGMAGLTLRPEPQQPADMVSPEPAGPTPHAAVPSTPLSRTSFTGIRATQAQTASSIDPVSVAANELRHRDPMPAVGCVDCENSHHQTVSRDCRQRHRNSYEPHRPLPELDKVIPFAHGRPGRPPSTGMTVSTGTPPNRWKLHKTAIIPPAAGYGRV